MIEWLRSLNLAWEPLRLAVAVAAARMLQAAADRSLAAMREWWPLTASESGLAAHARQLGLVRDAGDARQTWDIPAPAVTRNGDRITVQWDLALRIDPALVRGGAEAWVRLVRLWSSSATRAHLNLYLSSTPSGDPLTVGPDLVDRFEAAGLITIGAYQVRIADVSRDTTDPYAWFLPAVAAARAAINAAAAGGATTLTIAAGDEPGESDEDWRRRVALAPAEARKWGQRRWLEGALPEGWSVAWELPHDGLRLGVDRLGAGKRLGRVPHVRLQAPAGTSEEAAEETRQAILRRLAPDIGVGVQIGG